MKALVLDGRINAERERWLDGWMAGSRGNAAKLDTRTLR